MKKISALSSRLAVAAVFLFLCLGAATLKDIESLIGEQKFEQASKELKPLIEESFKKKNDVEYARLVIKELLLRIGLHGYETGVEAFREKPRPKEPLAAAMMDVAYAKSLTVYFDSYSWEIRKREKITEKEKFDLKKLTADEIHAEALRSYQKAWDRRAELGEKSREAMGDMVTPNSYPREIRGTLRDTFSYLLIDILQDTSGWTPEQSNEVFLQDGMKLLEQRDTVKLDDPAAHPLKKIAFVLNDLSSWHTKKNRYDAALDARIELHRILFEKLTAKAARAQLIRSLQKEVRSAEKYPWASMGYAHIAKFYMQSDLADAYILAMGMAQKGQALHPESPGATSCRDVISEILTPHFNVEGMNIDGVKRKTFSVTYKNLSKLYFKSVRVDFKKFIETTKDYSLRPGYRELAEALKAKPDYEWERDLKETKDYKNHNVFVEPPKHKKGFYVILASNKPDFTGVIQGVQTFFSDLTFNVGRTDKEEFLVNVYAGDTGMPVKDASVVAYKADYQSGHSEATAEKTDEKGLAKLNVKSFLSTHGSYFFLVSKGDDLIGSKNTAYMSSGYSPPYEYQQAFIYTDRSIYRPGQKVLWKIVAYTGKTLGTTFKVAAKVPVSVELRDANYEVVKVLQITTNEFGSASGSFEIPQGRLLGEWSVTTGNGNATGFKVEEYKRPTFLVEMDEAAVEYRLNKEAVLKGKGKYYFGMPLTKGKVKWTVHRKANLPWWCFWGGWNWGEVVSDQLLTTGISDLKEDGSFAINFTPAGDETFKDSTDVTYTYTVKVDVTDEGGETQSTLVTTNIGFAAAKATVATDKAFYLEKEAPVVRIQRTDLNGRPLAGKGSWKLYELKEPSETPLPADLPVPKELTNAQANTFLQSDDFQKKRWSSTYNATNVLRTWAQGKLASSGDVSVTEVRLAKLEEGAYRFVYESNDSFGTKFVSQQEFLVVNKKSRFHLPALFVLEKSSLEPGETARLLVQSGYQDQYMVVEFHKQGRIYRTMELIAGKNSAYLEFPVKEEDRGGLTVSLRLIRDYQPLHFSQTLMVPWTNKDVDVAFSTFRDKIRPGSKETWAITLKGKNGRVLDAKLFEILAYMYDKSLDVFRSHRPVSPLMIYPNFTQFSMPAEELGAGTSVYTNHGYFHRPTVFLGYQRDQVAFYPSYGIGGPGARRRGMPMPMSSAAENFDGMKMKNFSNEAEIMSDAAPLEKSNSTGILSKEVLSASAAAEKSEPQVRSNFSENGFWLPHLKPNSNGSISFEFQVPDSVTSWSVWALGISKDLQSGSVNKTSQSIKELMVRPYLPRFFREGDEAVLKVVLNNSSEKDLKGTLTFEILDEDGKTSLAREFQLGQESASFTVKAGASANVSFKVKAPVGVKNVTVKVIALSGNISDGEQRSLPVLPGRMHLAESKFVTLKNKSEKKLSFEKLVDNKDPTLVHDAFVVTLDAQLFYSVLSAVPYLYNYPYTCTEVMLNNFVTSGILSSVFRNFPEVAKMAAKFSERKTRLEKWDDKDPNRKLALEEAPWLAEARGGASPENTELMTVLHPDIARNTRDKNLRELKDSQTGNGGFPWFKGGPPSPYVTLYILYGFSKALEFDVDVPKDVTIRAWKYVHNYYIKEIVNDLIHHDVGWEFVTFLNYVLSNYPDATWSGKVFTEKDKKVMLDFSMKHWKHHSPYLKAYLARTLKRARRDQDAKLVWDSVMDSAKTSEEEGTHWAAEDRSWLWYNDTIETHALALRTGSELGTNQNTLEGLVQWLFLNKKLNHWKSTRATAEVIYSLTHFLKKTKQLGTKEKISVVMGGKTYPFEFDPDTYTGKKNQIVIEKEKVSSALMPVTVKHESRGFAFASATWHYSTEKLPAAPVGDFLSVSRTLFRRDVKGKEIQLVPITEKTKLETGDEIEVHLSLKTRHPMEYVHLRDPRGAGFEPVDQVSQHKWDLGLYWYEEIRDSGTNFFFEKLPQGEFKFKYRIRAATAGTFSVGPATVQPLYAPEFNGFSEGHVLKISER